MRLLLVEDYEPLARSLAQGLRESGYAVDEAPDGEQALAAAQATVYDAMILDVMIPRLDGFAVLARLRQQGWDTPVLVLTARDQLADRVTGLDLGADDYLPKPFAFTELLARLRSIVRRRYQAATSQVRIGDLEIDTAARSVRRAGQSLTLSALEYALLEYLAMRRGQIVTRGEIWQHVYDGAAEPASNVVDVYVGYLRRKIDHGHPVALIHTHRGLGYSLGPSA